MSDLNQGASIEADPEFLRILANVQHEPNVRLDAEDYVLIDFIDNLARRTPAATTGELPPLPDADDIKGPHGYVEVYFTHTVLDIQREAFELGQRAAIEADRAQRQAAHTAEMAQWARDNGLNVPPQWEVAPASAQPAELTNAEFLAKRLGRVAKLAGVPMPDGTYEQIAEVAGTILGQIAYALERGAQPDQRDSAADGSLAWGNCQLYRGSASPSPAAQPAKDEQNNGWQKLDDDFRLQFGRLVDVVLTNGVYEYGRRCNQVDWTQVQDWRYADSANNGADEQKGGAK